MTSTAPATVAGSTTRRPLAAVWLPGVVTLLVTGAIRIGRTDLWLDEGFSVAATHHLAETLSETHGTMALYYLLLTPWALVSEHPVWVRLPSLALMAAAVVVFSTLVARRHGATTARIAGLFAAATPLVADLAIEARSYALLTLLCVVAWDALDRSLRRPDSRWPWVFGGAITAIPLAHGLGTIQIGALFAALLWARPPAELRRRLLPWFVPAGLVTAGLLLLGLSGVAEWVPAATPETIWEYLLMVVSPYVPVFLLVVLLAGAGAATVVRRRPADPVDRFHQIALVIWGPASIVALVLLSLVRPALIARYSAPAAFGVAALAAIGLTANRLVDPKVGAALVAAVMVVVTLPWSSTASWSGATSLIAADAEAGDAIAFGTPDDRIPFEVAWGQMARPPTLEVLGTGGPLGSYDRFGEVADVDALVADAGDVHRIWLVDQLQRHQASRQADFLADPAVTARFRVAERHELPNYISVVLLVER